MAFEMWEIVVCPRWCRYFKSEEDVIYFHSMMSDFFLGKWGGGTPKPFKFTEIQKHRH